MEDLKRSPYAAGLCWCRRWEMKKLLRLLGGAVVVVVAIRIADLLLFPALPLLVTLLVCGAVAYVVINGGRAL
jgi:hypothetical protein